jgi:ATP-dependent RNA helicase DeaD
VGRSGRAITFFEPRQKRDVEAIERHAKTTMAPWKEGAHVKPAPIEERPRRHAKPQVSRNGSEPQAKLIVNAGRAAGLEVADVVAAFTGAAGLDGEAVRNVRVLDRFSFVEVPAAEAQAIVDRVTGTTVRGRELRVEPARG